jgi:hypothetical protein
MLVDEIERGCLFSTLSPLYLRSDTEQRQGGGPNASLGGAQAAQLEQGTQAWRRSL